MKVRDPLIHLTNNPFVLASTIDANGSIPSTSNNVDQTITKYIISLIQTDIE